MIFTVYIVTQKTKERDEHIEARYTDIIKKLVLERGRQLFALLAFIKEHEADETGISREKVVKYMNAENISSRVTTLNMINVLLQERALIDDESKPFQSNLKINPDFDFGDLWAELLVSEHSKINLKLEPLKQFIRADKLKQIMSYDEETLDKKYAHISREIYKHYRKTVK